MSPDIYYSLYSLDTVFRKKWLPNAIDPYIGLDMLTNWQQRWQRKPKIHYAFIENENDSENDILAICDEISVRQMLVDINIVRYNPFSERYGKESSMAVIERNQQLFQAMLPDSNVNIITKVGVDVKASCGMFVSNRDAQR